MLKLPTVCPSCDADLRVAKLQCLSCGTEVSGTYDLPPLMLLDREEQEFVLRFLENSGSLKEMANQMGKSYPTVRNKLDDLIAKLKQHQSGKT
ncbi:DUF2089 family protein [Sphingobacterium corticis]|uniref:DUF2089 family protein n=1 Tax=Sphingobacterium corticis TaxID=1812823 RepID=A0ABW5NGS8_9SPHI